MSPAKLAEAEALNAQYAADQQAVEDEKRLAEVERATNERLAAQLEEIERGKITVQRAAIASPARWWIVYCSNPGAIRSPRRGWGC